MEANVTDYINSPELISQISDLIRIVDPLQKKVIEHVHNHALVGTKRCFNFLGKNKACDNCQFRCALPVSFWL